MLQVAAGEAKSVYFPIVPSSLGKIDVEVKAQSTKAADAVRRQLLIEVWALVLFVLLISYSNSNVVPHHVGHDNICEANLLAVLSHVICKQHNCTICE